MTEWRDDTMFSITRTIGLALVAAASTAGAQITTRVPVATTSKLWIEGTSNVHNWKCDATTLDAAIDIDAATQLTAAPQAMLKKVMVKVPVKSIKCGHGKMDDNLYKALKADDKSEISYIMATFETIAGEKKDEFTLRTVGTLTLAGQENTVTMDVAATRMPDGTIKATGTVPIKMTAFGVKPPTAMFGTIKTGDEVKVKFELSVGAKVIAAALQQK
jgi:polyisoprenoid-binding protein YceI